MSYFTTTYTPSASHQQNYLQIQFNSLQLNCATAFFAIKKLQKKITTFLGIPFFKKLYLPSFFSLAYYNLTTNKKTPPL